MAFIVMDKDDQVGGRLSDSPPGVGKTELGNMWRAAPNKHRASVTA
jgi:hypothetical protein